MKDVGDDEPTSLGFEEYPFVVISKILNSLATVRSSFAFFNFYSMKNRLLNAYLIC